MGIEELYKLYSKNYLVDTDTRSIRKNTMFFALKGDNFNGNKFAAEALNKGARYVIIDDKNYKINEKTILVNNVLKTLQQLANFHRRCLKIPIIGLTGSNGKTTTKELIKEVLSQKFTVTATRGNLNNHIGVPLTLLSMNQDTEVGIVEMGANNFNEIAFLCTISEPDYGYITNFGKAHLQGFGSIEGVVKAKCELYQYIKKHKKTVFVNTEDSIQVDKTVGMNTVFFDDFVHFNKANPFVSFTRGTILVQSNLIGNYNFSNIAAAITIGAYFKIPEKSIIKAIENYIPKNNRSEIIETRNNKIILDAYNANPTSMKAAIDNFYELQANHKMLIIGDMFELGNSSLEEHQTIVNLITDYKFEKVLLVGDNFYQTHSNYEKFKSFSHLKDYIDNNTIVDTYILIKGSRGMALERLLELIN